MPSRDDSYLRHQQSRWLQHDAARCVRPDAARFLSPGARIEDAYPALLRKYSPSQPRVPAGSGRESGQWTDGSGVASGAINDTRVISDVQPDNLWIPGTQYAADTSSSKYTVNLDEEEVLGGHTLLEHVGKTDDELLASVRADRGNAGVYRYARQRNGSFGSRSSANDFVNRRLKITVTRSIG